MNVKVVRFGIIVLIIVAGLWAYKTMYVTPANQLGQRQSANQNTQRTDQQRAQESTNRALQKAANAANPFLIENPLKNINIKPADVQNPFAQ